MYLYEKPLQLTLNLFKGLADRQKTNIKKRGTMERRAVNRKLTDSIKVEHIISNENLKKLCKKGHIVDTSVKGFLVTLNRKDLLPDELKSSLTLESLVGHSISLYLPQMELELDGTVGVTRHCGKGQFEIFVSFSPDTPTYWRECLMDLLPQPGEF